MTEEQQKSLNERIDFLEMAGDDPELLVMLLELRRHRADGWKQHAKAAEAKLAEMKEQKADFHVRPVQTEHGRAWVECGADYERGRHFFTRPAPAINLADLVPDEMIVEPFSRPIESQTILEARADGFNLCRTATLRNIEEKTK